MTGICYYCGEEMPPEKLRPYGPDKANVCCPCVTNPEHPERDELATALMLAEAQAIVDSGHHVLITPTGLVAG